MLTGLRLFLEPVALIGWLILAFVAVTWWRTRALPKLGVAAFVVYMIVCTPLGANVLLYQLESRAADEAACSGDDASRTIVLLTGGLRGGVRDTADIESLQLASYRRTVVAAELARKRPQSIVVIAGGGTGDIPEADVTAELLQYLGIPRARMLIERNSRNTYEAGGAIRKLLPPGAQDRVDLVTSAAHMVRARRVLESSGLRVCPRPADRQYLKPVFPEMLLPQISALQKSTSALHEYLGLVLYAVRGRG
jgi:uncharacterized SAM-binding protein YcdF (DUF218 family)